MKQKGFAPIIILVLIIALAAVGYFGYKNYWPKIQKIVVYSPAPSVTADPTTNWKTYTNTKYLYSLKYPASFTTGLQSAGAGNKEADPTTRNLFIYKSDASEPYIERYINLEIFQVKPTYDKKMVTQTTLDNQTVEKIVIPGAKFDIYSAQVGTKDFIEIYVSNDPTRKEVANQILSTFKFTYPSEASTKEDKFTAPTAWVKFTTQDGLKLCLPPKWESNQYGTLTYNRDTGYQPTVTIVQSIPYTNGSYADAYYNFWKQEYQNVSQLVTATQTNINGHTAFTFTPIGEPKSSPEGLAVAWYASGKLWKAGLSNWSMINSSQTAFLKDFYTMISCSF